MNIIWSVIVGLCAFYVGFYALNTISPVDGLLKFMLYSVGVFLFSIYNALYMGAKRLKIKPVGVDFCETVGA